MSVSNLGSSDVRPSGNQHLVENAAIDSRPQEVDSDPVLIDLEAFDYDVVISSPGAFAEANNHTRGHQGQTLVIDLDSEEHSSHILQNTGKKGRRSFRNQELVDPDICIYLEASNDMKEKAGSVKPHPPPPKKPTFNCPVCLGPFVEEMSTKCGHIFCKACIEKAIVAQKACPTCRKKLAKKDVIRVYLPATT